MAASSPSALGHIDPTSHTFATPIKRINDLPGVHHFLSSPAYELVTSFILHLNASVSPLDCETNTLRSPVDYTLASPSIYVSSEVQNIIDLIHTLESFIEQAPPDPGPRRFGNVACRKWHALVEDALSRVDGLLDKYLPTKITSLPKPTDGISAKEELLVYLLGSFGSSQRLDYGTGHELSFAAFLCGIWVLDGFQPGRDETALTLKCFDAYFHLIRKLVLTYTLEPAGSHGVWGLDDHSFLPYIFGSAQLTTYPPTSDTTAATNPPIQESVEGLDDVPKPIDIVKSSVVERERLRNLYFGAVGFINDVKTGPFWEHSPILFDISGVQGGWGKINKGMLKMYNAEVLGKFPVVQHFPFGSIFSWGIRTNAATTYLHSSNAQTSNSRSQVVRDSPATTAPWASKISQLPTGVPDNTTRAPRANSTSQPPNSVSTTRAPWTRLPSGSTSELRNPSSSATEKVITSKLGGRPISSHAPFSAPQPPYPTLAGMYSARPLPAGQLDGEDSKAPWATGREESSPPLIQQATEANLGPRRTNSPDSMLAASLDVEEAAKRRGSLGTGGVRVAETGDLKRKQPSVG